MSPRRYLWRIYRHGYAGWPLAWGLLALTWMAGAALLALSGWFIAASALAGLGLLVGLNIFTPSTAIRGLALFKPFTRYLERVIGHSAVLRLLSDLRVRLFSTVAAIPASLWQEAAGRERHADIVTRLTLDIDTLDAVPLRVIGPLLAAVLTLFAAVAAMAHWGTAGMAGLLSSGGIGILLVAAVVAAIGRRHGQAVIAARGNLRIALHDHLDGLAELRAYGKADASRLSLEGRAFEVLQREMWQELLALSGEHLVQAMVGLWLLGIVAMGWGVVDGPVLALLAFMTLGLGEALGGLPGAWWRSGEAEAAAGRIMALEAQALPEADTADGPIGPPVPDSSFCSPQSLEIAGLRCQRQPGQEYPWSISVLPGRPLVIYGASGCGKSSLLDTLAGELQPVDGCVFFGGRDWLALPDELRYREMAYLGQQDHILDLTVREFLRLGLSDVDDPALHTALQSVALDEVFRLTGEGLDYRLGPRGSRISGGQARRLHLAALLLRDPGFVLLDEPFRGLDAAVMAHVLAALRPWLATRCCILVTHAPEALPLSWDRCRWPAVSVRRGAAGSSGA